jgi:CRP-like cAMP-binding protein
LAARFRFLEIDADSVLIEQGKGVDGLFVLLSGNVVIVRRAGAAEETLAELNSGDIFGEMSLLNNEPASATVRATSKCFALKLPAQDFREIIMTHPQVLDYVSQVAQTRTADAPRSSGTSGEYSDWHLDLL